jgi:hypothetical protein
VGVAQYLDLPHAAAGSVGVDVLLPVTLVIVTARSGGGGLLARRTRPPPRRGQQQVVLHCPHEQANATATVAGAEPRWRVKNMAAWTNAWARALLLAPLTGTGVEVVERVRVVVESLVARVPSLPWLLLGLAAAGALTLAGFVLAVAAAVVVGIVALVIAEAAAVLTAGVVALWAFWAMASVVLTVYVWLAGAALALRVVVGAGGLVAQTFGGDGGAAPSDTDPRAVPVTLTASAVADAGPAHDPYLNDVSGEEDVGVLFGEPGAWARPRTCVPTLLTAGGDVKRGGGGARDRVAGDAEAARVAECGCDGR